MLQQEKALEQNQRPSAAKNKQSFYKTKKMILASGFEKTIPGSVLLPTGPMPGPKKHICVWTRLHTHMHVHITRKCVKPPTQQGQVWSSGPPLGVEGHMFSLGECLEMVSHLH